MTTSSSLELFLSDVTATSEDGDHLVQMDRSKFIHLDAAQRSAQQASGYLQLGDWSPVTTICDLSECIRPDHLNHLAKVKEEQDLTLVATHTTSLADLYRKARSRGLVTARTEYGG